MLFQLLMITFYGKTISLSRQNYDPAASRRHSQPAYQPSAHDQLLALIYELLSLPLTLSSPAMI